MVSATTRKYDAALVYEAWLVSKHGGEVIAKDMTTYPSNPDSALPDALPASVRSQLVQHLTPDAYRGRVAAVHSIFVGTSNQLGGFESGLTTAWWGPVRAVLLGGVGAIVTTGLVAWRSPKLRTLGEIEPHAAEAVTA